MHVHGALEARGGGEDLALADGKRRIAFDHARTHAAERLNAERQRRHIEQKQALDAAGEDAALQARAHGDAFVGIDALEGKRAGDGLDKILHGGNAARAADHQHLADLGDADTGVVDGLIDRLTGRLHQMVGEVVELCPRQRDLHMQRAALADGDIRQADRCCGHGRKLDLGLFRRLAQTLHGRRVAAQIDLVFVFEFPDQIVHDALVKIVAAKVIVAGGGQHLDHTGGDVQNGHVERAAAKVIDHDLLRLLAVNAVGQRRCGRLIDDALDVESGNAARVLRGLTLGVGEVGGDGNDGVRDRLAEIALRIPLELLQDHCGDLLRRIFVAVDVQPVIGAHLTLDGGHRAVVIRDRLTLGKASNHTLTGLGEADDGRRRSAALGIGNDDRLAALHDGDAGIGGAKVNANDL